MLAESECMGRGNLSVSLSADFLKVMFLWCVGVGRGLTGMTSVGCWALFRKLWPRVEDTLVWPLDPLFSTEILITQLPGAFPSFSLQTNLSAGFVLLNQGCTFGVASTPRSLVQRTRGHGPFWRTGSSRLPAGLANIFLEPASQLSFLLHPSFVLHPLQMWIPGDFCLQISSLSLLPREPDLRHMSTSLLVPISLNHPCCFAIEF